MSRLSNPLDLIAPPRSGPPRRDELALLIVDMQYLDADPDWGIGREAKRQGREAAFAYYWERVREIIPRIRLLQATCRELRIEVIHTRIASLTRDCRDSSLGHHLRRLLAPADSREAEFLEELGPVGDEIVISKTTSSPFSSTAIDRVLRNLAIRQLVVCGVATNACVEMTVRDAADRDYGVILVEDACAGLSEELHRAALLTMDGFMGLVRMLSCRDACDLLRQVAAAEGKAS
jgi:nicotinamidase-related amidase